MEAASFAHRVPDKAHMLQDWGKLKKYVRIHKNMCPNRDPALVEGGNNEDDVD